MEDKQSTLRTDAQLELMLAETGDWVVNGQAGQVLCFAPSLRVAIQRAKTYAVAGAVVTTIRHRPIDTITIFPSQIQRLERAIMDREGVSRENDPRRLAATG